MTIEELRAALEALRLTVKGGQGLALDCDDIGMDAEFLRAQHRIDSLLAALPSDGVVVSEEELAAAMERVEAKTWGGTFAAWQGSMREPARAIFAALRKESGDG